MQNDKSKMQQSDCGDLMPKEPRGFYNDLGEILERKGSICTKRGIILYKGRGDDWKLELPDGSRYYGGITTIKLINLIYYLHKTNGNLDKSLKLAGMK